MKKTNKKKITAKEFDKKVENNEDLYDHFDFDKAIVVKRVNVDMPKWLIDELDREAIKLNVSRQAIIKIWLSDKVKENKKAG